MRVLDLNCDVGESFGNFRFGADEDIMPFLTSANVACGFHAGDPLVMERTVALANRHQVSLGIHWGLPDLVGFGRRRIDVSPDELRALTLYQMGALQAFASASGARITHLVPHGALFWMLSDNVALADAVIDAIMSFNPELALFWPAPLKRHELYERAKVANIKVVKEFAADLQYGSDGSLILERVKKPVEISALEDRLHRAIVDGKVDTVDGATISFEFDAVLLHGDSPGAAKLAAACRKVFEAAGVVAGSPLRNRSSQQN